MDDKKRWVWDELWKIKKYSLCDELWKIWSTNQKKWWFFKGIMDDEKKIMGLGRIMEDKIIISVRRIMEDSINKKKWWYFKGIMDDKKNNGFGTNYGR